MRIVHITPHAVRFGAERAIPLLAQVSLLRCFQLDQGLASLLEQAGLATDGSHLELWPGAQDEEGAARVLAQGSRDTTQGLIALHPGGSGRWKTKRWELTRWARVCDLLAQRGLSVVADAARAVAGHHGITVDLGHLPDGDPGTRRLMRQGETLGCFYVESPGMRALLKKLKADTFPVVVAASSVIRPGPSDSGMARSFVLRHLGYKDVRLYDESWVVWGNAESTPIEQ